MMLSFTKLFLMVCRVIHFKLLLKFLCAEKVDYFSVKVGKGHFPAKRICSEAHHILFHLNNGIRCEYKYIQIHLNVFVLGVNTPPYSPTFPLVYDFCSLEKQS